MEVTPASSSFHTLFPVSSFEPRDILYPNCLTLSIFPSLNLALSLFLYFKNDQIPKEG